MENADTCLGIGVLGKERKIENRSTVRELPPAAGAAAVAEQVFIPSAPRR